MTRGVDKLRTVCGRLRRNAARERFCKSSDSRRFRRRGAPEVCSLAGSFGWRRCKCHEVLNGFGRCPAVCRLLPAAEGDVGDAAGAGYGLDLEAVFERLQTVA